MRLISEKIYQSFNSSQAKLIIDFMSRDGLDIDSRIIVALAALQTLPRTENLSKYFSAIGFNSTEIEPIYEVLLQGYLFVGYPRAIESLMIIHNLLSFNKMEYPRDITSDGFADSMTLLKQGRDLSRRVHRSKFELIHNRISEISPHLGFLMLAEGYGRILARPSLKISVRELAIIASLTMQRSIRQLESHIRGARNVGCKDTEIYEAILSCLTWGEPDCIFAALQAWEKITGKEIADSLTDFVV